MASVLTSVDVTAAQYKDVFYITTIWFLHILFIKLVNVKNHGHILKNAPLISTFSAYKDVRSFKVSHHTCLGHLKQRFQWFKSVGQDPSGYHYMHASMGTSRKLKYQLIICAANGLCCDRSFPEFVNLSRSNTYFSGKDPVSYPLILFLSLFNGFATSPVLQWHTDLIF